LQETIIVTIFQAFTKNNWFYNKGKIASDAAAHTLSSNLCAVANQYHQNSCFQIIFGF
jgi:hypothetical protein